MRAVLRRDGKRLDQAGEDLIAGFNLFLNSFSGCSFNAESFGDCLLHGMGRFDVSVDNSVAFPSSCVLDNS